MKFVNAFTYVQPLGEINDLPSCTQPEMTMSLKEILARYTRGGEIATLTPVYQDHDDFDENPDIMKMDAMERLQYAAELKQSIYDYQNRQQKPPEKTEDKQPVQDPKPEPEKASEDGSEAAKQ